MNGFLLFLLGALVILLAGYALGRRVGLKEGHQQGQTYAPLELRRLGLEKGRCQICGTKYRSLELERYQMLSPEEVWYNKVR